MIKLTHILFSHPSIHYIIKEYKLNYGDYLLNEMESCRNLKRSTNTKLGYSLKKNIKDTKTALSSALTGSDMQCDRRQVLSARKIPREARRQWLAG